MATNFRVELVWQGDGEPGGGSPGEPAAGAGGGGTGGTGAETAGTGAAGAGVEGSGVSGASGWPRATGAGAASSIYLTGDGRVVLQGRRVSAAERAALKLPLDLAPDTELVSIDRALIQAIKEML